jgi:lysophospholipase L1-like esterase
LTTVLGVVAATLVLAEATLQIASWLVHDRETVWRAGSVRRVLCVGDSHTYGTGVSAREAYPGRLQEVLDGRAPGVYSVVNKGVPGFSTTQVRSRLSTLVGRLHPDVVIVWCGANDAWNRLETAADASWRERLEGFAMRSRLYRLVVVALHDRSLAPDTEAANRADARPRLVMPKPGWKHQPPDVQQTVMWGDVVEQVEYHTGEARENAEIVKVAATDYEAMIVFARANGLPIAFVTYPTEVSVSGPVNEAVRDVTARLDVPRVESAVSITRVPAADAKFLWALHPNAAMYAEIARDVADVVMRLAPPP